jgi:site-specific DNA-methyltransferase (adenine-specific)
VGKVVLGDCLEVLRQQPKDSVDLVYLDPPFFTQKVHTLTTRDLTKQYAFSDEWESIHDYLGFLRERVCEIRRVMKDTATLYFHCDKTASHHIRLLLDDIFGDDRFAAEIIWTYRRWSNSRRGLLNAHQTIFMYTTSDAYTFNALLQEYSQSTNLDQILQKRQRNHAGKAVYARTSDGQVILNGPKKGVPLSDVWEIPFLNPKARERAGYPTQKPILLLERILALSSNPGDLVLDPFCGSGTSLVAAALLERDYLGIDISPEAVELAKTRLANPVKSDSDVLAKGLEAYDELPDYVKNILANLPVKLVQRNSGVDAIHDEFLSGQPVLIRVQRQGEDLSEAAQKLHRAGQKMQAGLLILIRTGDTPLQPTLFSSESIPGGVTLIDATEFALNKVIRLFKPQ